MEMEIDVYKLTTDTVRITGDKKICELIIGWLAPYMRKEIKKAANKYECVTYWEAFHQVVTKEKVGPRVDKFILYEAIVSVYPEMDRAGLNS